MKQNIHPKWDNEVNVKCACGSEFTTGSTKDSIIVDICSKCHPFFTGEMKFVDTQGRVDKFMKKREASDAKRAALAALAEEKRQLAASEEIEETVEEKSFRQILAQTQSELKKTQEAAKKAAKTVIDSEAEPVTKEA